MFFTQSSTDECPGWLYVTALMNWAPINMGIQVTLTQAHFIALDIFTGVAQLGYMVDLLLVLLGNSIIFSIMVVTVCVFTRSATYSIPYSYSGGLMIICAQDFCTFVPYPDQVSALSSLKWYSSIAGAGTTRLAKEGWTGPEMEVKL